MTLSKLNKIGLSLLFALGLSFTSCQDDFDDKSPVISAPVAEHRANMTILEFKQAYWPEDASVTDFAEEIGNHPTQTDKHIYVSGRVISSDQAGNVFKSLVIQDETAALAFSINQYDLYLKFPVGQEIVVDLTGLYAGMYRGLFQIGMPSESNGTTSCSFLPDELFKIHAEKNGEPDKTKIKVLTFDSFNSLGSSPADLQLHQSQLIRFNDVKFELGGKAQFSSYKENTDRNLLDNAGSTIVVRTSGYSDFWQNTLPAENFDIQGIMGYHATKSKQTWQMILNSYDGVMNVGNPSKTPGTKENPYTMEEWIAKINANEAIAGWVSGFIVGAVAPGIQEGVKEITSDADIEWTATPILPNTLVIGATPDTRSLANALVIELPEGSDLYTHGNLKDHPELFRKAISVSGIGGKVLGANGVDNNNGTPEEFTIEGVQVGPTEGDGSEASPYSCKQVIGKNPSSTTVAVESGVWVSGYIVGTIPTGGASTVIKDTKFGRESLENAAASNLVIGPTSSCTDYEQCVVIQLVSGSAVRKALNLVDNPDNLGQLVAVKGDIMKYCSGPGIKNTSEYKLNGSVTPDPGPSGEPKGTGTQADPYNAAKALQVAAALDADKPTEKVYVSGIISSIKEVSTSFGNATFSISDDGTTAGEFSIFLCYYINGDKFTAEDQIKVGDKVVLYGALVNYKGNTPQMTQGGQVVSINGGTVTPDPDPDPTPDPITGNSADFNTFNGGKANTMSYATYKTAQGWTADWALILAGGADATNFVSSDTSFLFPCLNGRTDKPGKLTSPTISGGIKKLTFSYGFPYNETKVKFTINIRQGDKVVATETVTVDSPEKAKAYTFTKDLSVSGDFVIEIVNDLYSQTADKNRDRLAIWNLTWEK